MLTAIKKDCSSYILSKLQRQITDNKIVYFDPQDKTHTKHTHKLSLEGVIVSRYGYFKIKNVRKSVELQNNICPMEFLGGE